MTLQPKSYSDLSSPVTAAISPAGTPARAFTEPLRELAVLALLAANGVFLFLGISGLFFVIDGWAADFGLRSAAEFATFVGPLALGLPMLAMLLSTHVAPVLGRSRAVMVAVGVEYAVSAFFGAVTFLGAFAHDISSSVRATLEGLLERCVWLALLVLAIIIVARVWIGLFSVSERSLPYARHPRAGYAQTTYGKPYPGQPMYPQTPPFAPGSPWSSSRPAGIFTPPVASPSVSPSMPAAAQATAAGSGQPEPRMRAQPGVAADAGAAVQTSVDHKGGTAVNGWPPVPPPPMPGPLVIDADATMRVTVGPVDSGGEATTVIPPPRQEPPAG